MATKNLLAGQKLPCIYTPISTSSGVDMTDEEVRVNGCVQAIGVA
jgi:hypothetical protein